MHSPVRCCSSDRVVARIQAVGRGSCGAGGIVQPGIVPSCGKGVAGLSSAEPPWKRSQFERRASGWGIAFQRNDHVPDGQAMLACDGWAACVVMSNSTADRLGLQDDAALWSVIAHQQSPSQVLWACRLLAEAKRSRRLCRRAAYGPLEVRRRLGPSRSTRTTTMNLMTTKTIMSRRIRHPSGSTRKPTTDGSFENALGSALAPRVPRDICK